MSTAMSHHVKEDVGSIHRSSPPLPALRPLLATLCKTLQRRLLDLLLDRSSFLTLVFCAVLLVASAFHFGEAWMQWSADKYNAVFNSFSDNIAGRSLQSRLCQYVPVDVVYTWVNGSDPVFLDDLKHAKERLTNSRGRVPLKGCPYAGCVPSHMVALDRLLPQRTKLEHVRDQNAFLSAAQHLTEPRLACGSHVENRTVLWFSNADKAKQALSAAVGSSMSTSASLSLGLSRYNLSLCHWTTDWTAPNSFPMDEYFVVSDLPPTATREKLLSALPVEIKESIMKVWYYEERHLAVLHTSNSSLLAEFLSSSGGFFEVGSGVQVGVSKANLISQLPMYADDETHKPGRYADYEQLRYSLRSLEKYAPWVRQIFLVTAGQIPYWLNLDHPRVTVVTHEEIFRDLDHLPTFSSPAIEANIHRIPGLSDRFLYLNDDIMLGSEVWPEDFFTEHEGFKVRLSWPIPDCSSDCPSSWVKDGYCDRACNTSACQFDGGDCLGPNPRMGFDAGNQGGVDGGWYYSNFSWSGYGYGYGDDADVCNDACLDNWLGDDFCDGMCNVAECGYDAGDCGGDENLSRLPRLSANYSTSVGHYSVQMASGATVAVWNLSRAFQQFDLVGVEIDSDRKAAGIRSVTISEVHKALFIILKSGVSNVLLNMTLEAKRNQTVLRQQIELSANTTGHIAATEPPEKGARDIQLPREVEEALGGGAGGEERNLSRVDEKRLNLTEDDRTHLDILRRQLEADELTVKGFNVKRARVLRPHVRRYLADGGILDGLVLKGQEEEVEEEEVAVGRRNETVTTSRKLLSFPSSSDTDANAGDSRPPSLLDAYGESLLFVDRLLSAEYGHARREVPAHIPHFVDRAVMERLQGKFPKEWEDTSAHFFRSGSDMQFSFSYFHFLMSEKRSLSVAEVFDEFDTDGSGTWSDREIRTLLTRVHNLPLYLETVRKFEDKIINCSKVVRVGVLPAEPPPYERYFDSSLPVVSRELVVKCDPLALELERHFRNRHRFRYTVLPSDSQHDTSFVRLSSNASQVVSELDGLRKRPRKFVCINDDTDPARPKDNLRVQALLVDFLESVLPVPSQFELPPDLRNRWSRTEDLAWWIFYRHLLRWAAYISLAGVVITTVAGYFKVDLWEEFCRLLFCWKGLFSPSKGRRFQV